MNYDPRKAIRQAMMIARREVTAPNKASIGGQRHMLAYITPYEAELLMRRGGSGRLTEYGVPAFDDGDGGNGGGNDSNASQDTAMSDPNTQTATSGNEGSGAGPTGAGIGGIGQDSQDDVGGPPGPPGGPNSGFGSSMTQDPEATQAAANMATAVAAQQAGRGVGIADTGGAQPTGFGAAPGIGEAMEAYEQGVIGLGPALGYSAMAAFSPPGMQVGTVTDEVGNQTPGANVNIGGMIGGIAGAATGVPGAGIAGGLMGSAIANELGVPTQTFSFADGGAVDEDDEYHEIEAKHFADGGEVLDEPQKTVKAYKLFRTKKSSPGQLFPLYVNANKPVPIGKWIAAEEGPMRGGKVKSSLGDLAYRPGWHAGDLPMATHIGNKSSPDKTKPDYRPDEHVWAEVEMPADVDWQSVADQRAKRTKSGAIDPKTAHITDQIPHGGFYRYKTNPNMTGNWLISGGLKVNRVLSDDEVKEINDQAGVADLPRLRDLKNSDRYADGGAVDPFLSNAVPIEGVNGASYTSQADLDNRIQQAALGQGYADGGQVPMMNVEDDPTVQRALDVTRQAQPSAPQMAAQSFSKELSDRLDRAKQQGFTIDAYHGSPREITAFKTTHSSPEGYYGPHHYFTSSLEDVNANYAGEGPDLTHRIALEAHNLRNDELHEDLENAGINPQNLSKEEIYNHAQNLARKKLGIQNQGVVYPVKLRIKNPVVVGGNKQTVFDYHADYDEEGNLLNKHGSAIPLIEHTEKALNDWDINRDKADDILGEMHKTFSKFGKISASKFDKICRDNIYGAYNKNTGEISSSGAVIADIFQRMGYDGIDMDASVFGPRVAAGGMKIPGMAGVRKARHYIVFDPKNIRSKHANFDPARSHEADLMAARGGAVGYADGGMPGDDPTVQQALDLTRQNDVSPIEAARSVASGETYAGKDAPAYSQAGAEAGRLPIGGGVSGSAGRISASHQAPLEGLPTRIKVPLTGEVITAGPNHQVRAIAEQYMRDAGLPYNPPTKYAKVDAARAKRIADEYERMADDPDHPLVKAAYDAMIRETMAQYQAAKAAGFKAEFWDPEKERDPYEASPRLAIEDVNKNHHMYVFPTYFGYGSKEVPADAVKTNPLLADSGERWNGYPVTVNDIFRAVHDYFGHAKEGVGFRHDGEENAWRSHASMYSPLARLAMTSETRGQNSWLNFGPHGEKNRNARTEDTVFADQKIGVMAPWTTHEGAEDFLRPEDREAMEKAYKQYRRAYGGRLGYADGGMMGDDPTVQRALDITRGAQPAVPDMARQAMGQSSKLASTFQAENRPAVIVSPRPGKIGGPPVQREAPEGLPKDFMQDRDPWTFATPNIIGASQPPPVQHPVFNEPRMEKITNATRQIFKNKDFHGLIRDLTGLQGLNITPTVGTWQNEMEPSFILSHPDMTDEHAEKLAHLLGFGFQQDAILQSKHNPDIESGAPAVLMGTGKKLTPSQIDDIHREATKHGVDFTVTGDGKAAKFVHLGDQAGLEDFYGKIKNISDAAKLPELYHAKTTGKLIDAQSYLNGIFGSPGGEVRDQTGTGRSPDLFRRIVNHVLAPYAKAVAGEGYRLSPERLAETYALNDEESGHVRGALYPGKKDDRTTIPLMTGEEQLDVRPTGARGRASVGDVLYALQNRAASKGQIDPGDFSDSAKNDIAQNIAKEVAYHVQNSDKSAIGWYDDSLKQAMSQYAGRFPELGIDPQKTMLFHAILGITSQGNDVYSNSIHAMRLYDQIQNGGKSLPEAIANLKGSFGDKTRAIEINLMKLHHLLDTNGYDRMSDLFNQTKTVSEWNSILRQDKSLRGPNGEKLKVEGGSGQKVTGWMVFGPKIGSFINNLHGDYSTLTADLWFSRTWNRLLGHNFIHTPLAEAKQYRDFRDALRAEYYSSNPNIGVSPIPKTEDGKLVYDKKGRPEPWEYGSDAPALSKEEFDDLLNDPDKMLNFAQDITKRYRDSGFKDKSDLRRRAKNWIENRELPVAVPRGDLERQFQQDTVEEAQRLLKKKYGINISVADIQAALWFHEKELFGKLGVASEKAQPADYADAARRTISLIDSGDLYRVKSKEKGKKAKPQEQFASGGMTPPMRDSAIVDRALRLTSSNRPMVALADLFQRQLRGRPPS